MLDFRVGVFAVKRSDAFGSLDAFSRSRVVALCTDANIVAGIEGDLHSNVRVFSLLSPPTHSKLAYHLCKGCASACTHRHSTGTTFATVQVKCKRLNGVAQIRDGAVRRDRRKHEATGRAVS